MLRNLPKNLIPKFRPQSRTPNRILNIISDTLEDPIKIPNYMERDTPFQNPTYQISPYDVSSHIAEYQNVEATGLRRYLENYQDTKYQWEITPFSHKKDIFLNAANLIENKYYNHMIAYTMVGQNKNVFEAELDAICELVDFLRFNVAYAENILQKQPIQTDSIRNVSEYNSLNGFVAAITPFNFTAIGGNLASSPLLFGNSVVWKPSSSSIISNHLFYEIMLEAGLPEGVLNFCPMEPNSFLKMVSARDDLAALLFTGSSDVFDTIHHNIMGDTSFRSVYPRVIGETGGKNFHFVDESCENDMDEVVNLTVESAFNYSGQKCSACSILYLPEELMEETLSLFKKNVQYYLDNIQNYGVINQTSYDRIVNICNSLRTDNSVEFIIDDGNLDSCEYFVSPKVLVCRDHEHYLFNQEFFAPILTIYPYSSEEKVETMKKCASSNNYALTGSIFSNDQNVINMTNDQFRHKTGNFYINDKSTGSVVGQQPFGGSGKSGTNDKAGDVNLLFRLFNQRNIKINHDF